MVISKLLENLYLRLSNDYRKRYAAATWASHEGEAEDFPTIS